MSYKNLFDENKQRQAMEKILGNTVLDSLKQQQQLMEKVLGNPVYKEQQQLMEKVLGNPVYKEQQQLMEKVLGSSVYKEQQKLKEMILGSSVYKEQQKLKEMILGSSVYKQQQQLNEKYSRNSVLDKLKQQQQAMEKVLGSSVYKQLQELMEKVSVGKFQFGESLVVVDTTFSTIYNEIEDNQNTDESTDEVVSWLSNYITIWKQLVDKLQLGYNVLDTKIVNNILFQVLSVVSSIITIVLCFSDDTPEIHIHNEYEEIEVKTESSDNKTDIYIEHKKSPKDDVDYKDDWYSGGERT